MKHSLLLSASLVLFSLAPASAYNLVGLTQFPAEHPLTLWYNKPATMTGVSNTWMEYSLPIGNGQLGASLYGDVVKDEIQFNEKTLWTGTPNDIGSYGQYKNFGSVFAEDLSGTFGNSYDTRVKSYVRYLDLETATAGVNFSSAANNKYTRRYFVSYPNNVIVARYNSLGEEKLHMRISLKAGDDINASTPQYALGSDGIYYGGFSGSLTTVKYNARLNVVASEGSVFKSNSLGIEVDSASEIVVYLTASTTFDGSVASRSSGTATTVRERVMKTLSDAVSTGVDAIYEQHLLDFQSLMGRVSLQLGAAAYPQTVPTNTLIDNYNNTSKNKTGKEANTLFLEQLYFSFGRYLEICSSRGVDVPSNLQGIWNNLSKAPWNSDIHTNINVEMNYWPAEPTNLSEMHLPFLNYIITNAASANWKKAATSYGKVSNGWTVFTESNIYGGMSTWGSNYFVANAWYCTHLWQHYRFTRDVEFLKRAFPAMWSAALFWMERMIEDRVNCDGTYVAPDEYSPEQNDHSSEDGTAHAQQLIYELLSNVSDAISVIGQAELGLTTAQIDKLNLYLEKTDQGLHTEIYTAANSKWSNPRNGVKKGDTILREWKYATYDVSNDPSHRHLSHLMALYPLSQLPPAHPMFPAAVNSLKLRGDDATGWSMGWKVNLWARALDGDHAHVILKNALKHSTSYSTNQYAGGIYYNLYDSHSPFQIDGNFGVCSGVAEMLLQSHTDTLQLLPALPSVWDKGYVRGLKAVGNFTVDQTWENKTLTSATITAVFSLPLPVTYPGIGDRFVSNSLGEEVSYTTLDANTILIDARAGEVYTIDMSRGNSTTSVTAPRSSLSTSHANPDAPFRYDLQGRQVEPHYKGIVVSADKKILHP